MVVHYNGNVYPCYPMAENATPIGNLKDESLEDIWYGPTITRQREAHAAQDYENHPTCQVCPAVRPRLPAVAFRAGITGVG